MSPFSAIDYKSLTHRSAEYQGPEATATINVWGQERINCILMLGFKGLKQLHSFFYKNLFYKSVQAEINQNFKNIPRTYPG